MPGSSQIRDSSAVSGDFGDAVLVLMRSPGQSSRPLSELRDLILEPMDRGQLVIARGKTPDDVVHPVALICVAKTSDALHERLKAEPAEVALRGDDWQSGENVWFALVDGPADFVARFVVETRNRMFPGQTVWFRAADSDGKVRAAEVPAA